MWTREIKGDIAEEQLDLRFARIYPQNSVPAQRSRYIHILDGYEKMFGDSFDGLFSAPGRTEIGGNHTDHQQGCVVAAALACDAVAAAGVRDDGLVKVWSEGYGMIELSVEDLEVRTGEYGSTTALIRGVAAGMKERGYRIGGFQAYMSSNVLGGSGLSSSAAFETLMGVIISELYNQGKVSPVEIAQIGQYAENRYFGKPCGLMDQMACSVGGVCAIDFADPQEPTVEKISLDLFRYGYCLCITNTRGSHADLTEDYAAVPEEMRAVARFFGKEVLRDISMEQLMNNAPEIRRECGDRAWLRAFHFIQETGRAKEEAEALKRGDFHRFLELFRASGDSSYKYLQNVYTTRDVEHQNIAVGLAASEAVLGTEGVARVHGGGFAGTIQALVRNEKATEYQIAMNRLFGVGSCEVYSIRNDGGVRVV